MRKSDRIGAAFVSGGLFTSEAAWQHSTRTIDTFEIIVVTKGTIYLQEDGRNFTVHSGEYVMLYPNRIHGGTRISHDSVEFFWVHFRQKEEGMAQIPVPDCLQQQGVLTRLGVIVQLLRQLLHYSETRGYPDVCCDYTLALLVWEILKQSGGEPIRNALAERVHEYVRSHSDVLLSVADVETNFGYNADYLSRVLKTYRGRSLQQDIIAERLDRAKLLLQTSNYTVERVARELGYTDANLFVKFFRYHMHMTPTSYRNTYTKRFTNHK